MEVDFLPRRGTLFIAKERRIKMMLRRSNLFITKLEQMNKKAPAGPPACTPLHKLPSLFHKISYLKSKCNLKLIHNTLISLSSKKIALLKLNTDI